MLYIEKHNLAFVHIPKNAGISVRTAIEATVGLSHEPLASDLGVSVVEAERLSIKGVDISGLGRVQPVHIPLAFLENHFPASWAALTGARSFSLIRDPRARFFSALLQHLQEYRGSGSVRIDDPLVRDEAKKVCEYLAKHTAFCEMEFIHFARQTDFVDRDGERIVTAIFPVEAIDKATRWIERETGLKLTVEHGHTRREPTRIGARIRPVARLAANGLLPRRVRDMIHPLWVKSGLFANAASRYDASDLGSDVEAFIAGFYAPDLALYTAAKKVA